MRHRQLVIGKRSPEYHALRRAGRTDSGTSTPRIDDPCAGRRWNSQDYAWRSLLHRLAVVPALHSPCHPGPPPRPHATTGGVRPAPLGWGPTVQAGGHPSCPLGTWRPTRAPTPGLGGRGQRGPTRSGARSVLPPGHRPYAGCLCHTHQSPLPCLLVQGGERVRPVMGLPERVCPVGEPSFSGLDEMVTKAARVGCLMLVVAQEWSGYPRCTAMCVLCPRRWCFPEGRPVYLRGGTDMVPAPRWRTWAFLLDSRQPQLPGHPAPPPGAPSDLAPTPPTPAAGSASGP